MPIEIAWTAAPALTAFVLALILTRTEFEVRVDPKVPPDGLEAALRHGHRPSMVVGIRLRAI